MDDLKQVEWNKYVQEYDGTNGNTITSRILADYKLTASTSFNSISEAIETILAILDKQKDSHATQVLNSKDIEAKHQIRAKKLSPLLQQIITNKILHDENPAINLFSWDKYLARLNNLLEAFPEPEFVHALAIKANPIRGILRAANSLGCGAECASFAEAKHALSLGIPPWKIVYDSPCKTKGELRDMIQAGVYINLDNEMEIAKVNEIFSEQGLSSLEYPSCQIGLRINPVVGGGSIQATSTATETSKFGLPWTSETSERLIKIFTSNTWLQGIHVHVGSQGCPIDLLVAGVKRAVNFAQLINEKLGYQQIKVMDIGGGLPTIYDGEEVELFDFNLYAHEIRTKVPELFTSGFSRIITEFGRSIFVKPGITVSKVEAVKDWLNQQTAVVHFGADQFLRAIYLPHLWPHVITVLSKTGEVKENVEWKLQDIAGPLCFSGDFIAKKIWLPIMEVGDIVVLHDTGGYTLSMNSKYNSRQAISLHAYTKEVNKDGLEAFQFALLKERETPEETLSFWGLNQDAVFK